jgi:hypothetical protein
MRPERRKAIEAVIEVCLMDNDPLWPLSSDPPFSFLRLHSGSASDEVGMVMQTACAYGQGEILSSITETLEVFLSQERFVMPGGLQFVEDGVAKVVPGCCCGLENWREWLNVPYGQKFIWAGHDPSPSVEYFEQGIRIWQDEKGEEIPFIEFTREEMESLLKKTEADLKGFLVQLEKWTAYIAPEFEQRIVSFFAEHMHI